MTYTVLGPNGFSRPPYGSFAGKPASSGRAYTQPFTVLGPNGYSRPPYASFTGKPASAPSVAKPRNHPYFATHGQLMHR